MHTLQVQINDKILQEVGLLAVKKRLQKEIEYLYYENVAKKIKKVIQKSGINNVAEIELARQKSWKLYKENFLKDVIK